MRPLALFANGALTAKRARYTPWVALGMTFGVALGYAVAALLGKLSGPTFAAAQLPIVLGTLGGNVAAVLVHAGVVPGPARAAAAKLEAQLKHCRDLRKNDLITDAQRDHIQQSAVDAYLSTLKA